jgi:hypothetical protein
MLTIVVRNVGFAPTHSEKHGHSPMYISDQSSKKSYHTGHLILQLAVWDLNWTTQHLFYWLVQY